MNTNDLPTVQFLICSHDEAARILDADVNLAEEISLHLSQDGDLAAVVNPFGQYGVVADLTSGQITMRLERGNYHTKHCRFPISFVNLDGPSLRTLCQRDYFWGRPLCWLDDLTLAIWGYGEDDDFIIPAVRVFDVATGKESRWFAGPDGELAFDTYLFAFSEEHGTTVWETKTGERLHLEPGLKPECYHPGAKVFISLLPDGRFQVSRLMQNGDTGLFISPT